MMKFVRTVMMVISVAAFSSCSIARENALPETFKSTVEGLYLDQLEGQLCSINLRFIETSPETVIDRIFTKGLPKRSLVTQIMYDKDQFSIELASDRFCEGDHRDELQSHFSVSSSSIIFGNPVNFEIKKTKDFIVARGLDVIDLSFQQFKSDECAIVRDEVDYISLDDIIALRYSLAIPIVYYNSASGSEVIVFEESCGDVARLVEVIDYARQEYLSSGHGKK